MKIKPGKKFIVASAALLSICAIVLPASGAAILKLDDALLLNDPAGWNGGVAPGSADVAQFDGPTAYTTTNTWTLGAPTSWSGIQVLSPITSLSITNDGNALTLGAAGVDLSAGTNSLTIYPNIVFSAPQVWNVTNTRTVTVFGTISGAAGTNAFDIVKMGGGTLNIRSDVALRSGQTAVVSNATMNVFGPISDGGNAYGITKTGAGTLSLRGTNTFTGPITVNQGTMSVETNASTTSAATLTVNNPAGGSGTFGSFTVNAGGVVNGLVFVKTNSTGTAINCTVNGSLAGNVTTEPGSLPAAPNANVYSPASQPGTGFINVNGGGSLAASGFITNNGQVKFSGNAPITFGTFIMTNGFGGIWDANQSPKTFTFPNNSSLAYFRCDSNAVSTLQVAGNGTCNIKWFGYQNANSTVFQKYSYTNTFNGGNWNIGYIGQNNSTAQYVGNATITGGANLILTNYATSGVGPAYTHGTWNIINGSMTFYSQVGENQVADNCGLNIYVNNSGGGPGLFTITNGGMNIGFATANTGPENNSLNIGNGGTVFIKGTTQIGTATASPNAETNAINLSGGKLVIFGTLQSTAVAGAQDRLFIWTGGQLTAQTITTGAGFNDPASWITTSTVSNTAGILAPGDTGVAGKTTITGGYVQTAGGTLAVDIGGTSQANTFTNLGSFYDFTSVSGNATVAGNIKANLINSYTPAATTAFTVLTGTGGLVANAGTLGYNGLIPVYTNGVLYGGKYFQALVSGNNLILTNYGVSVAALAAKFSPTNAVGVAPATPTFTDNSTGVITNRHWDFGDATTLDTTSTSVPHTYSAVGTYTVTLTVYGLDGSTSTTSGTVNATLAADQAIWKGGLSGNAWDLTTANWFTNGVVGAYHDPDFVTFDDSGNAASPVNLTTLAQPSSVTFSNVTKSYTISGSGFISGNSGLTLAGDGVSSGGSVTLLTTNNYTGATVIDFGTLQIGNGTTDGGIDSSTAITNNGALKFNQNATHSLAASLAGSGAITKSGSGTLILSGDNSATYTGPVTINGGTLNVASDNTLGASGGTVNLTNATLQISSASTLNRNLNIGGTNVSLNVNGTVILPNAINGVAQVTVGGAGILQVDNGGNSVSLPTNVVLNGGSLSYLRTDNYAQPGTISGTSASSAIDNLGGTSTTNSLTFANGNNTFASIITETNSYLVLNGSANSTNVIAGADQTGGGAFGPRGPNTQIIVNGGNYFITNSTLFGTIGGGFQPTDNFIVSGGTVVCSWYGANTAATDGGMHFFRNNLEINSGTLWTKVWGAAIAPGFDATFNMNGGTFRLDDSGTLPGATAATTFFGLGLGNHSFANIADKFSGSATVNQTGGAIILAASTNNNVELGCANNSPTNHASTYTIVGGSLSAIGGVNGGNVKLGGSADGASTALLTLTNSGKIVASGNIQGYSGAAGSQAFTFGGGTLVAGGVNMTSLADALGNPTGTLVNNGGTLSPGDTSVAGKTSVTGNYSASSSASLAIDLNGATAATAFTNSGAFYDTVAVSGTAALSGSLIVRTNGFTPTTTSSFTILSAAGGISGSFNNLTAGRVTVTGSTNTFAVLQTATSVILTNFSGAISGTPTPVTLTNSFSGGVLTLTWPNGLGWRLLAETNSLSTGITTNPADWHQVSTTSPFNVTPNPANGTVFYKLVNP